MRGLDLHGGHRVFPGHSQRGVRNSGASQIEAVICISRIYCKRFGTGTTSRGCHKQRTSTGTASSGRTQCRVLSLSWRRQLQEEEINRLNLAILKRVIERGRVYLSNASLRNRFCLRACIVNHRTKDSDVDCVVAEVLAAAKEIGT